MNNISKPSLVGDNTSQLLNNIAFFSDGTKVFVNTIDEALKIAKSAKINLLKFDVNGFNKNLFTDAEAFVYNTQSLLDSFLYVVNGVDNYVRDYSEMYTIFDEQLKIIEEKVKSMRSDFLRNYEVLEATERQLESKVN